jgi:hypothetical protein
MASASTPSGCSPTEIDGRDRSLFESGGSVDVNILGDAPDALIEATKDFQPTMYSLLASA